MKKILPLLLCFGFFAQISFAQVGINTTGAAPATPAMLDVSSTNKGLLIPRVALSASNSNAPIGANIVTSLLVYNTATAGTSPNNVVPGYYYWNGTTWVALVGSAFTLPYAGMISSGANALDINNTVGRAAYFQSPNSSETMRVYNSGTGAAGKFEGTNALETIGNTTIGGNMNLTGQLQLNNNAGNPGDVLAIDATGAPNWASRFTTFSSYYTSSTTIVVPANVKVFMVESWGAGGGGSGEGGGGAGGYAMGVFSNTSATTLTVTIGSGGSPSTCLNCSGSTGGNTTVSGTGISCIGSGGNGANGASGRSGGYPSILSSVSGASKQHSYILSGQGGFRNILSGLQKNATTWLTVQHYGSGGNAPLGIGYGGEGGIYGYNSADSSFALQAYAAPGGFGSGGGGANVLSGVYGASGGGGYIVIRW